MGWNTRGLRGSTLEELINMTNDAYANRNLAVIQKIPTPIKPVKIDSENKTVTLAYFEQKSTVDYIGAVQGIPVCFDAKETTRRMLPIQNIHEPQSMNDSLSTQWPAITDCSSPDAWPRFYP